MNPNSVLTLETQLAATKTPRDRIDLLNKLAWAYLAINLTKSTQYAQEAQKQAKNPFGNNTAYKRGMAESLRTLATVYQRQASYTQSLILADQANGYFQDIRDLNGQATLYAGAIALSYLQTGLYDQALDAALHGLELWEELDDAEGLATALNIIGAVYMGAEQYDLAQRAFEQGLHYLPSQSVTHLHADLLKNMADVLLKTHAAPTAQLHAERSLQMYRDISFPYGEAEALYVLGQIQTALGDIEGARGLFEQAIISARHAKHVALEVQAMCQYGLSLYPDQPTQAIAYLQQALDEVQQRNLSAYTEECHAKLAALYEREGRFEQAYDHLRQYNLLKETVAHARSQNQQNLLRLAYHDAITQQEILHSQEKLTVAQEAETRLASIIDIAPDAIIILDEQLRIVRFNRAAVRIFRYAPEQIIGQHINLLIPERSREMHLIAMRDFINSNRPTLHMDQRIEIMGLRQDGHEFPAMASVAKMPTSDGLWFTVILRDITERKRAEEAIYEQNAELNAFAHTVAHDLKNPLSVISGLAKLITDELKDIQREDMELTLRNLNDTVRRVHNIIDELLLLATVRRDEITLLPLDTAALVHRAQQRLMPLIRDKNAVIKAPQEWETALGYAGWVEEIWTNYLSNALKYGGNPPIIELGSRLQDDGYVRFWVKDNGPGIPQDQQPRLFAEFTRLSKVRARGHGLGLSIVLRIVQRLHGVVGVESTVGQGSTFYFTLPRGV